MADIAVVQAAAITTTGTQDFTVSGFGTPVAALFFLSRGATAGTAVDHAMISFGATDGTRSKAIAGRIENAANPADATSHESTTAPIITLSTTANSIDGVAGFDSWITDGVRINWTDASPVAYLITCVLFGGTGVTNAYTNSFVGSATAGGSVDINTVGFEPDVVIFFGNFNSFNDVANSNCQPMIGVAVNDGSDTQLSMNFHHSQTTIPTLCASVLDSNSVGRLASGGAGGLEIAAHSFDASGFSVQTVNASLAWEGAYLALKFNGLSAKVLSSASPTTSGPHTITGAGFTPQFGFMLHSASTVVDTVSSDTNSEVFGISAFTSSAQGSAAIWGEDNSTPTDAEAISDSKPVSLRKADLEFMTATFTEFTSDGVTFNYSQHDGTARQRLVLFIESANAVTENTLQRSGRGILRGVLRGGH